MGIQEFIQQQILHLAWLSAMTCLFISPAVSADQIKPIVIGQFSNGNLNGWSPEKFTGETEYRLINLEGFSVLRADSRQSASGLVKKQRIDLNKTPYLNWRWRIENRLKTDNEGKKADDDYAARVYVLVSGGLAFWRTRAVNYVWSYSQKKDDVWPNAYAGNNVQMLALRDRGDSLNHWYQEKRNIKADLEKLFGEAIDYIDAVAIMTDSDNTKGRAIAYYGDMFFSVD